MAWVADVLEDDAGVLEAAVLPEKAAADGADPGGPAYIARRSIQSGVTTSMSSFSSSSSSPSPWTAPRLILAEKLKGPSKGTMRRRSPPITASRSRTAGSVEASTTQTIS